MIRDKAWFLERCIVDDNGCWVWQKAKNNCGYGRLGITGEYYLAHRASYTGLVGAIPEGLVLDHLCCNKLCINPQHLEPVTQEENISRWVQTLTHCQRGHEYTEQSSYSYFHEKTGNFIRRCRLCRLEYQRQVRGKKKATA